MTYVEKLRVLLQNFILLIVAFLSPVESALMVLFVLAVVDVFGGIAGNVWTGKEHFRFKKAFSAIYKMMAYCVLVILVHFATYYMGESDLASMLVKYLTWVISYWYLVNILSNLRKAFPRSQGFAFLYLLFSLKILPLILQQIGFCSDDIKELADQAHKTTNGARYDDDITQ